jgi:hypothetical protein
MTYVYTKKQSFLFYLIKHIDKKAISELVPKFLECVPKELYNIIDLDNIRLRLINTMFENINVNSDLETILNISTVILDITENKQILEMILNNKDIIKNIISQLILDSDNFSSEQNHNYYEILFIFTNLIRTAIALNIKLPSIRIENNEGEDIVNINLDNNSIDNTPLGEVIIESIGPILDNFVIRNTNEIKEDDCVLEINGTFGTSFKPLGLRK